MRIRDSLQKENQNVMQRRMRDGIARLAPTTDADPYQIVVISECCYSWMQYA